MPLRYDHLYSLLKMAVRMSKGKTHQISIPSSSYHTVTSNMEAKHVISQKILLRPRLHVFLSILFIVAGVTIALFPTYPSVEYQVIKVAQKSPVLSQVLHLPDPTQVPPEGNWLVIPSINVKEQIWEGDSLSVINQQEGVWHQIGDISHNFVLAGHRFQYLPPNTHTFYNLNKLKTGDAIILSYGNKTLNYSVKIIKTVTPDQVDILNPTATPELTLYTCSDWTTSHRLVVVAVPVATK